MNQFQIDRSTRPDLFIMSGPVSQAELDTWILEHNHSVPEDLRRFWLETGGGDIFESETILSPFGLAGHGDDVEGVNDHYRPQGMPEDYLVFHVGFKLTAIDMGSGIYVCLNETHYQVTEAFASFEVWYVEVIRREYADRYGLND